MPVRSSGRWHISMSCRHRVKRHRSPDHQLSTTSGVISIIHHTQNDICSTVDLLIVKPAPVRVTCLPKTRCVKSCLRIIDPQPYRLRCARFSCGDISTTLLSYHFTAKGCHRSSADIVAVHCTRDNRFRSAIKGKIARRRKSYAAPIPKEYKICVLG